MCIFVAGKSSVHTLFATFAMLFATRQSEMADLARRATRWVGTLSHGNVHVKFHDDRLRNGGDITY